MHGNKRKQMEINGNKWKLVPVEATEDPAKQNNKKTHNNMFGSDLCTISAHHDCTETNGNKRKQMETCSRRSHRRPGQPMQQRIRPERSAMQPKHRFNQPDQYRNSSHKPASDRNLSTTVCSATGNRNKRKQTETCSRKAVHSGTIFQQILNRDSS